MPPPLTSDKDGFVQRTTYMCQIFIWLEPLKCASSPFCLNHLHLPDLLLFLNTVSFLKPLLVQIPNFVGLLSSLVFQNLFIGNNPFLLAKHCNWEPM